MLRSSIKIIQQSVAKYALCQRATIAHRRKAAILIAILAIVAAMLFGMRMGVQFHALTPRLADVITAIGYVLAMAMVFPIAVWLLVPEEWLFDALIFAGIPVSANAGEVAAKICAVTNPEICHLFDVSMIYWAYLFCAASIWLNVRFRDRLRCSTRWLVALEGSMLSIGLLVVFARNACMFIAGAGAIIGGVAFLLNRWFSSSASQRVRRKNDE